MGLSPTPKASRSQLPRSPRPHGAQSGEMPRVTQPSTGSTTTRRPSSVSATTSWPGVNGKLTIGSK